MPLPSNTVGSYPPQSEEHPFRAAFRTRDLDAWRAHFSPDIKLHSPLITSTFDGYDSAVEPYELLFGALKDFQIELASHADGVDVFQWRCIAAGRPIEGVDLIRYAADGKICEIRVMIRTLPSLAAFALAIGPALARRRGRLRGAVAYALTYPLKPLFALVDAAAPRLAQRKRKDRR